jgi:CHRD domain/VPDSG-CTERM motif
MKTLHIFLLVLSIAAFQNPSFANTIFTANITHDQELGTGALPLTISTGAPRPLSFGTATFDLNNAQTELSFTATIFNIDITGTQTADTFDNLVAAHIHVGAPPGANAPVRWGFFGSPDNDNNPDNLVITPFASGVGGTFSSIWNLPEGNGGTTLTTNLPSILAGDSYINFHTVQFGGGEIRGQILGVPDMGSTVALLMLAVAGLICLRSCERQKRVGT